MCRSFLLFNTLGFSWWILRARDEERGGCRGCQTVSNESISKAVQSCAICINIIYIISYIYIYWYISGWWSIQMSQIQRQGKVLIGPGFNIDGNDVESTDNMIESKRFCCLLPFNHTGKLTHQLLVIWFNNVVQLFVSLKPFIRIVILAFLHLGAEQ